MLQLILAQQFDQNDTADDHIALLNQGAVITLPDSHANLKCFEMSVMKLQLLITSTKLGQIMHALEPVQSFLLVA